MNFFSLFYQADVNGFAVLVAALAGMVLGGLWYSPLLFGNMWIKLAGLSKMKKPDQKSMWVQYSVGFVSQLVMACVLAHLLSYVIVLDVLEAIQLAFLLWLGFFATTLIGSVLWEMKSPKLYFINAGYWLTTLVLMASIETAWPW